MQYGNFDFGAGNFFHDACPVSVRQLLEREFGETGCRVYDRLLQVAAVIQDAESETTVSGMLLTNDGGHFISVPAADLPPGFVNCSS